ncbi:LPS biosynthesis flippase [Proteiniphilum sp. UBA5384]|uniref:LPS biosynthesis flippase n=1 Tax=Proteiniphilum sp. UBA5384 TaxID=1947279 RepID=UPI0025EF3CC8|nr:LPS biosynthesis flippase [Proteiniphilum sp. UBA5384]
MTILNRLFKNIDNRTAVARKNILFSFSLKGISIIISFLLVPLTIDYLDVNEYGIWLTLSSLLIWINFFDIGLSNGLRNKLAESLAEKDYLLARKYVSTAFILLSIIMFVFFILFFIANKFLYWDKILNTDISQRETLNNLVLIVFAFFCLQFVFKTVGTILIANQQPAYNDLLNVLGNLLSLIIIYIFTKTSRPGSLSGVAITFSASPLLVFVLAYFVLFYGKYSYLRPTFSFVDFKYTKTLMGLGVQFFIIQLAVCIVVYSSTNIILTQLFGGESVTQYNIAYKYFNVLSMIYIIIITPFWTAATDAYIKKDLDWIFISLKKLIRIYLLSIPITFIMILFSNIFYKLWVGDKVIIPLSLSIAVAIYILLFNWSNTFIYFINGIGKIKLQLYTTVIVAILYIPVAIIAGKMFGVTGVVIASSLSLLPTSILMPIQCKKLYSGKANGIWNK